MTSADRPEIDSHIDAAGADVPEQFRICQGKRERLLAEGKDPYPVAVPRTHSLAEVRAAYPDLPADTTVPWWDGRQLRFEFA